MEPFRWRRTFFLGIVIYAASIIAPVFDTFIATAFLMVALAALGLVFVREPPHRESMQVN